MAPSRTFSCNVSLVGNFCKSMMDAFRVVTEIDIRQLLTGHIKASVHLSSKSLSVRVLPRFIIDALPKPLTTTTKTVIF